MIDDLGNIKDVDHTVPGHVALDSVVRYERIGEFSYVIVHVYTTYGKDC